MTDDEADAELKKLAWESLKLFTSEQYLGDGLYISIDQGMRIKLRAPRAFTDHEIYLEPETLKLFEAWLASLRTVLKALEVEQ